MTRRTAIASVIAIAMIGSATFAFTSSETTDEAVEKVAEISAPKEFQSLDWGDLSPPRSAEAEQAAAELNLRIDYMSDEEIETALSTIDRQGKFLVDELDDKDVSLVGYLVPLDFEADKTDEFVLVPYFGACIHVPPPHRTKLSTSSFAKALPCQRPGCIRRFVSKAGSRQRTPRRNLRMWATNSRQVTSSNKSYNSLVRGCCWRERSEIIHVPITLDLRDL